jgi:CheY-like chemotaxis protein
MEFTAGMMGKRALVVDDSRSSRASLAKQLADQQLEVDSAETAEQAIDYLSRTRPDVIFMDHLMPGMDGFQAMQAIKKDPRTASIPVLMYTSQEGELYLGQARALGAAGVLRKGAGDTEVRALLEELMVTERPGSGIVVTPPGESAARPASVAFHQPPAPVGPPVQELLEKESAVLREHVSSALDAHAALLLGELRPLLQDVQSRAQLPPMEPPKPHHSPVPWLLALAASIAAAVFGALLWQDRQQLVSLHAELANARSDLALLTARLVPPPPPAPVEPVLAEGEVPVAGGEVAAGAAAPIATSGTAVSTPAVTAPKPAVVAPVTAAAPMNATVPVAASANTGHTGAQ